MVQAFSWRNPGCKRAILFVKMILGVAKIFDWECGQNRKSHTMTPSNFFERRDFYRAYKEGPITS